MEAILKWLTDFVKENGLVGTLFLILLLDRIKFLEKIKRLLGKEPVQPHRRKEDDDVHFHVRAKDAKLLNELTEKFEMHLERYQESIIVIAEIKAEQAHSRERQLSFKEALEKLELNQRDGFKLMSEIKTLMIQQGQK